MWDKVQIIALLIGSIKTTHELCNGNSDSSDSFAFNCCQNLGFGGGEDGAVDNKGKLFKVYL